MEKRAQNPNSLTGVTTGFEDLDRQLSGLQKVGLSAFGGKTIDGKDCSNGKYSNKSGAKSKGKSCNVFSGNE